VEHGERLLPLYATVSKGGGGLREFEHSDSDVKSSEDAKAKTSRGRSARIQSADSSLRKRERKSDVDVRCFC